MSAESEAAGRWLDRIESGGLPAIDIDAPMLRGLADLLRLQEELLQPDLARILHESERPPMLGDGFAYAPERIRLGPGCRVDAGAVLDAREGPIVLGGACVVAPHVWLRGPFFASDACLLLGGRIGPGTSLGPGCRVHGEVEASIFLGFDNKAHDGFIGHSVLGEWVNLGASTTTSDLKNNYSLVSLDRAGVPERTRLRKVGAFLADHVKTGIGCLITCGTIAGVGSNLIGNPAIASKWVEDFSWGTGLEATEYDINKFLQTAEIVYGRRHVAWTSGVERALREVFAQTRKSHGRI
jgi:UDP-N-acetylglucosamine diphosphorylase/glucosamine-1-phosphate N-acetyltransferase